MPRRSSPNTAQAVAVDRVPFVFAYLDLIVLAALCWFAQDWLIPLFEPLATFIVQEIGDPFGWLEPLPIATDRVIAAPPTAGIEV